MPKERIYGRQGKANELHDVVVSWSRAHHERARDDDNLNGMLLIGVVPQASDTSEAWVNLDRTAVNRLIAALRRARDQAHGRDE